MEKVRERKWELLNLVKISVNSNIALLHRDNSQNAWWQNPIFASQIEDMISIYHNNRCSKSRDSLAILNEQNVEYKIIDYLINPPTAKQLNTLLKKLKMKPLDLIRKNEDIFKEKYSHKNLSDDEWIEVMLQHPILIERPIIVNGRKAVIGRPAEKVLEIL